MRLAIFTSVAFVAGAVIGYQVIPFELYQVIASNVLTVATVFVGAVLVRLNRGIPSYDWVSTSSVELNNLLSQIERMNRDYIGSTAISAFLIAICLYVVSLPKGLPPLPADVMTALRLTDSGQVGSALFTGVLFAFLFRVTHVVWRDYDLVRLQSRLIKRMVESKHAEMRKEEAQQKVSAMNAVR